MEPHEYEEREAEELRREELAERKRRVVPPPRATPRTTDEILEEARMACSDMDTAESTVKCMLGYLATGIQILESRS